MRCENISRSSEVVENGEVREGSGKRRKKMGKKGEIRRKEGFRVMSW